MDHKVVPAALVATMLAVSACTAEVSGRAVLPDYHGPDIVAHADGTTEILSPGTPITVGTGALSAACTAEWVVRTTSDHQFGMLTTGHCLRSLPGATVSLNYRDEHRNSTLPDNAALSFGATEATTYAGGEGVDVGLFLFAYTEENSRVPVSPTPEGVPVVTDISGRGVRPSVGANVGDLVCWYTGATTTTRGAVREDCGTVDSAGPLMSVSLDQNVVVRPQDSGAPAVVKRGARSIPLGVLSYEHGGKALVSVVGSAVAGTGVEIMTGMP